MNYSDLTDEQKALAKACKTPEELIALAKDQGVELTDEQLESIAGGWGNDDCDDCLEDRCEMFCPTAWHA